MAARVATRETRTLPHASPDDEGSRRDMAATSPASSSCACGACDVDCYPSDGGYSQWATLFDDGGAVSGLLEFDAYAWAVDETASSGGGVYDDDAPPCFHVYRVAVLTRRDDFEAMACEVADAYAAGGAPTASVRFDDVRRLSSREDRGGGGGRRDDDDDDDARPITHSATLVVRFA